MWLAFLFAAALWSQSTADQAFQQALRRQQSGQWTEAEQAWRAHVKQFGPSAEALANLGAVLVKQERFDDAVTAYRQALKLAPDLVPLRMNLGLAYFKSGRFAPAAEEFSAVLNKQPNPQVRQLRAISYLESERYELAAKDFEALMPSSDISVRLGLGTAYMRSGRTADARTIIEPVLAADIAEVKLLLGQVLLADGQPEAALQALKRAAELKPALPLLRLATGAVYWRQKNTAAALAEWRAELQQHPDSFQANYTLGSALALSAAGEEEAIGLLDKAVRLQPANASALYQSGRLRWQRSKDPEAVSLLERAVQSDPKHRQARYQLALVYQALGRKQDAAREFAAVRKMAQDERQRTQEIFELSQ